MWKSPTFNSSLNVPLLQLKPAFARIRDIAILVQVFVNLEVMSLLCPHIWFSTFPSPMQFLYQISRDSTSWTKQAETCNNTRRYAGRGFCIWNVWGFLFTLSKNTSWWFMLDSLAISSAQRTVLFKVSFFLWVLNTWACRNCSYKGANVVVCNNTQA